MNLFLFFVIIIVELNMILKFYAMATFSELKLERYYSYP
jgi:nitrogen fixation protein FixH